MLTFLKTLSTAMMLCLLGTVAASAHGGHDSSLSPFMATVWHFVSDMSIFLILTATGLALWFGVRKTVSVKE